MKAGCFFIGLMAFCTPFFVAANFLWPAVGSHRGFFDIIFWLSIVASLTIEFCALKAIMYDMPLKRIALVTLVMNAISAVFGIVFMSLIDISLQHLMGISWLWHLLIIYIVTVVANICIEGFVCLKFWPAIDKQKLITILAVANALSVGVCLLVAKLF